MEGDIKLQILYFLHRNISIHALRVEGDLPGLPGVRMCPISIHALRVEGDAALDRNNYVFFVFLSTPSGWRATTFGVTLKENTKISIHALRVEGDKMTLENLYQLLISIHALRVEGDLDYIGDADYLIISIHALRVEGDTEGQPETLSSLISIHALRVEGDGGKGQLGAGAGGFLSTPSGWRATVA